MKTKDSAKDRGRRGNRGVGSAQPGRGTDLRSSSFKKAGGKKAKRSESLDVVGSRPAGKRRRLPWRAEEKVQDERSPERSPGGGGNPERPEKGSPARGLREDVSPDVKSDHPEEFGGGTLDMEGSVPARSGDAAPPARDTQQDRDREALDRILEESGFSTVDQLDADDYALMREAKLEALAQLCEDLKDNKNAKGKDRLSPLSLAHIARQLGSMERGKLEAVQLKVGKPGDRPKRGVTFRARIGVQSAPDAETGKKAAGAAFEVTVEEER